MKHAYSFLIVLLGLLVALAGSASAKDQPDLVILDIGHSTISGGATSPDKRVSEFSFWYRNVQTVKEEIEKAGYRVVVCNRSKAPAKGDLAALAKSIPVQHFTDPDTGKRYPSKYHPDRIGAGMICADYGIEQHPACMVFLHLNCISSKWRSKGATGLVLHNKRHGSDLGAAIANALNTEIFCPGGISASCKFKAQARTEKALGGAGWLNTLDDEGIPAAIIECIFTDDRTHVDYLADKDNAAELARAVAHGIIAWMKTKGK